MDKTISPNHTELLLRAFNAAFFRDSISRKRQLHWYFTGQCHALGLGIELSIHEAREKLERVGVRIDGYRESNDWRNWNYFLGMRDGIAEVVGVFELDHGVSGGAASAALSNLPAETHRSEFRKELSTIHHRTIEVKNAFHETLPLHWYFKGKESGLKNAWRYSFRVLCMKFENARESAHEKHEDWKQHNFLSGVAAGLAEAIALAKFARPAN